MNQKYFMSVATDLMDQNPDNLQNPDGYLKHLEVTSDIAQEIVDRILTHYQNIPISREEVSLAAGLHDIGRPLKKDQLFHELRGAEYIEEHGLGLNIANSQKDVYRIAQMIRSHGFLYERWLDNEDARQEFEPIDTKLLLPRTWQEAIITYADDHNESGERVLNLQEKYEKQLARYRDDPKFKDDVVVRSIINGQCRMTQLCERVEDLANGKLTEKEIATYGFL
jgi:HD domain